MKQKVGSIVLIMLLIIASLPIMIFGESNGLADSGGGDNDDDRYLDFEYFVDTVSYLSEIIHNETIYSPGEIKKGRYFGSDGDEAAADFLRANFVYKCGFDDGDVRKVQLDYIGPLRQGYSEFVEVLSYELTLDNEDILNKIPSTTIPQEDFYPIVAVRARELLANFTMNTSFENTMVYNKDNFAELFPKWQCGIQPYTVTYNTLNDFDFILGNVVYVPAEEEIPPHDYDTVFLLEEIEGVTDQIDNATNASGILLMNNISTLVFQEAENYGLPIVRVNTADNPNEQNFTAIKQLLENDSIVIADNTIYENQVTFVHNLSSPACGPDQNFTIIYPAKTEDWELTDTIKKCRNQYLLNFKRKFLNQNVCLGIIIYDDRVADCHYMYNQFINTPRFMARLLPMFALPGFSVNATIGEFLWKYSGESNNTISGHVNQKHYEETDEHPGMEAYNVEADLHITHSPNDAVVILSSRYDGMWGECPGDSAAGNGIIMGIAKYMQALNQSGIKPKYNVTFLMTTNEENGYYGAQFYSDSHLPDNIIRWIGTDQLGFNTGSLHNVYKDPDDKKVVETITMLLDYQGNTGYEEVHELTEDITFYNTATIFGRFGVGAEDVVFADRDGCDTILIHKNDDFLNHHHRGIGLTKGDVLDSSNFDWNDAKMFYNITWETVKYFLYNPDCEFDGSLTYTRTDSENDDDDDLDTVEVTMPMKSILPRDFVRIKGCLAKDGSIFALETKIQDYVISNVTSNYHFNITLPPGSDVGYYKLYLYLYNSTGRINVINWPLLTDPNDTDISENLYLHPRGNQAPTTPSQPNGPVTLMVGQLGNWGALTSDANGDLVGQKWYMHYEINPYTAQCFTGLYNPEILTPLVFYRYKSIGTHQICVKAYDEYSTLQHPYESDYSENLAVQVTPWCSISIQQQTHQEGLIHVVNGSTKQFYGLLFGGENHVFEWNFGDHTRCSTEQNPEHTYEDSGIYNITFNVTDEATQLTGSTYIYVRVSDLDSNFNMSYFYGGAPDAVITFWNTSKAKNGNSITNITWDFDDGTISYESIVNHAFEADGDYNVTLTVKDSENNTDVDYATLHITSNPMPPEILYVQSPGILPPDSEATILAEIIATDRNLSSVTVNITTPNGSWGNYTMTEIIDNIYIYTLDNTSQNGQFNFTIWVTDVENNTNQTSGNFSMIVPLLYFESPTPSHNTIRNQDWMMVNVTVLDPLNTSAFIDWNHSLRGYWPIDLFNATGVCDNSTFDNFGVFEGGMNATNIKTGKYGDALEFDGYNDAVNLETNNSLSLGTSDFTFMVWENSDQTAYANAAVIMTNRPVDATDKGFVFGIQNNAYFYVTESSANNVTLNGNTDVTDHVWHHIAYVRKGTNHSIYVDGVYDAGVTGAIKNVTNDQHTYLSYGHMGDYAYFDGLLDEPQLYNRALSREEINASYNNGLYCLYHNFTGLAEGDYSFSGHAIDVSGNMSQTETRTITVDFDPQITGVFASLHTVGFGYNVTITANATDSGSGVNTVTINITYPDETVANYTMTYLAGDTYQYVFNDTWLIGQYNYTIWVTDNSSNSNSSSGHHFHVSAVATISIATLQDSYSGNQYINITDPPNPPENYTLVDRGLTWDEYYNTDTGQNILEVSTGPINYQNDTNAWTPINNTLTQLTSDHPAYVYGYRTGNNRGLFGAYFKSNAQSEWPVAYTFNRSNDPNIHAIRSKLVGVGYVDPQNDWAYEYLQSVQSSQGQTNDYSITYSDVFTGTDVTWSYGNTGLKEEIALSNTTKILLQNHPPSEYGLSDSSSYLVFITKLDHQNLNLYNDSGLLDGNVTISDRGVEFKDALGQFKCALPLGEAYELNDESIRQKLMYRIIHLNGYTYLLCGLKVSDLNAMTFPVVIDPTLTLYSTSSDGFIDTSGANYNTIWSASTGTVHDSLDFIRVGQYKFKTSYYLYRSYLLFNTSSLPSNAYITNATLSLYKNTDYSTTDFDIVVQNGQLTYPHDPLQSGDYDKSHYSGNGGLLNTSNFQNGYNDISLTNYGWLTKEGITKFCLRSSRDISGTAPDGYEFITFKANEFLGTGCHPRLVIEYRNQSKIKNTGSTDIKGYLLIQVQYYDSHLEEWVVDSDTINETSPRAITSGNQLALDTIFNGHVRASDLTHGTGTYRVYVAFRDPEGNILKTNDDGEIVAWWQFSKT